MVSMVSSTVSARNPKSTPNPQGFSAHAFELPNERKMKRATIANMVFNHLSIILGVSLFSADVHHDDFITFVMRSNTTFSMTTLNTHHRTPGPFLFWVVTPFYAVQHRVSLSDPWVNKTSSVLPTRWSAGLKSVSQEAGMERTPAKAGESISVTAVI